jgi:hypothetical protein
MNLLLFLGRVYESDSRQQEALETYRQALELSTRPPLELMVLLIRTCAHLGYRYEAEIFIEDYLARGGAEKQIEEWRRIINRNLR